MSDPASLPVKIEPPPNNERMEFIFDACEGQPPARQKRLIVRAAQIGVLDRTDAEIALDALNLRGE